MNDAQPTPTTGATGSRTARGLAVGLFVLLLMSTTAAQWVFEKRTENESAFAALWDAIRRGRPSECEDALTERSWVRELVVPHWQATLTALLGHGNEESARGQGRLAVLRRRHRVPHREGLARRPARRPRGARSDHRLPRPTRSPGRRVVARAVAGEGHGGRGVFATARVGPRAPQPGSRRRSLPSCAPEASTSSIFRRGCSSAREPNPNTCRATPTGRSRT